MAEWFQVVLIAATIACLLVLLGVRFHQHRQEIKAWDKLIADLNEETERRSNG